MAEPTVQKNFRLPWELAKKLEKYSKENNITQQQIVIEALQRYFETKTTK